MELRHLRYFVTLAKLLNFTKAAAKLHVAQPALSRQIRDLEDELGVQLLERDSQASDLRPTPRTAKSHFLSVAYLPSRLINPLLAEEKE